MGQSNSRLLQLVGAVQRWLNDAESEQGLGWPSDWSVVQYDISRAQLAREHEAAVRQAERDWGISYGSSASPSSYEMSSACPATVVLNAAAMLNAGVISRVQARQMLGLPSPLDQVRECDFCGCAAPRNPDHTCMGCGAPDKDAPMCRHCGRSQAGDGRPCRGCGAPQSRMRRIDHVGDGRVIGHDWIPDERQAIPRPPAAPLELLYK